jgi:hypothetical protein
MLVAGLRESITMPKGENALMKALKEKMESKFIILL